MTPEELTPFAVEMFEGLKPKLPPEISSRLKRSSKVGRHGTANTVFLFKVWDKYQVGLFDSKHFCYCLGYDPLHLYSPSTWYLHLWINTIRIYQHSKEIRTALEDIVHRQCPKSFTPRINDQSVQAIARCHEFDGDLSSFNGFILPLYEELIGAIHPYLLPIIDSFTYDLSSDQRKEVIECRKKIYLGPRHRLTREEIRIYSRSIPPSWRRVLLERANNRCVHCDTAISLQSLHIDHIKPFSLGGLTVIDNLQALCSPCNLKKGNRSIG